MLDMFEAVRQRRYIVVPLPFAAALLMYSTHWYPGPGGRIWYGDSVSFQFYAISRSLGHPPGYPQYLALTRAIASIPVGQAWQRVDFASSLFAAAALCAYFWLGSVWRVGRLGICGAVLTLALSRTFYMQATEAEVYSLNSFWVLLCVALVSLHFQTGHLKWWWGFFVGYGCALGHHPTMVLLVLPVLITVTVHRPKLFIQWQTYAGALLAITLGLVQYLYTYYLFIAHDLTYRFSDYPKHDLASFIDFTTGAGYKKLMFSLPLADILHEKVPKLLQIAHEQNSAALLLLGLLGMAVAADRLPAHRTLQLLSVAAYTTWALGYDVGDIEAFCTPLWSLCYLDVVAGSYTLLLKRSRRIALAVVLILVAASFHRVVIAKGELAPTNRLLAIADEQLAHVPTGGTLLVASKFEGNSALAALFRYLNASKDRGVLRIIAKAKECSSDIYYTDSARKQIRTRKYQMERVAHLTIMNENMYRLTCKK